MKNRIIGITCVIASATLYGLCAVLTKNVSRNVTVAMMSVGRGAMGALLLFLLSILRGKPIHIYGKNLGKVALTGTVGNAATLVLLNLAYGYLPVGTATTIHFMYPAAVCLIGAFFFREKLHISTWITLGICLLSMTLFMDQFQQKQYPGVVFALLSVATWTFQMVYLERSGILKEDKISVGFIFCCVICLSGLLYGGYTDTLAVGPALKALPGITLIALLNNVLAMLLLQLGIQLVGAGITAVLSVFEPVSSILFGWILLDEALSAKQALASVLIIVSMMVMILFSGRQPEEQLKSERQS